MLETEVSYHACVVYNALYVLAMSRAQLPAVCLHTRALRAIEQRLDALLQGRSGYPRSISGECDDHDENFCVEATADLTAACVRFDSGVYYECTSGADAIQAFFNRVSENEDELLSYTLKEDNNTIKLLICDEGEETLNFAKEEGTWIDQRNRI
jgi:hypothetical protein